FLLRDLPEAWAWRAMLGAAAVPAIILFLGVLRLPESPRYLVKHGHEEQARRVLSYIRRPDELDSEIELIRNTAEQEKKNALVTTWATLMASRYRYLVIAGVGVAAFQQFQGANAIFYYIPLIVETATGNAAESALMWPIIQGVILVLGSLLYMAIAERFNRRLLLIVGGLVMGASFLLPAIINSVMPNADPMMIVVFLSIYVAFYSLTWAPLTWVIVGEIFPLAIRGRTSGLASSINWFALFLVGLFVLMLYVFMLSTTVYVLYVY